MNWKPCENFSAQEWSTITQESSIRKYTIDKYAKEVLLRAGQKVLDQMQRDFSNGFHIVASDQKIFTVGNSVMNKTYSRKTGVVLETHVHDRSTTLKRGTR